MSQSRHITVVHTQIKMGLNTYSSYVFLCSLNGRSVEKVIHVEQVKYASDEVRRIPVEENLELPNALSQLDMGGGYQLNTMCTSLSMNQGV